MDNRIIRYKLYYNSENEEGLPKKALDVKFPDNFDPSSIPRDGNEYLHHVIYERSKIKQLVVSDIDPTQFDSNKTFTVPVRNISVPNTYAKFLPSLEWQEKKVSDFTYFKTYLEIYGEDKQTPTITTFNEDEFETKFQQKAPKYSTLTQYKQVAKIRMLEILMKYISDVNMVEDTVGTWIFAILVTLDIPLNPSTCHLMREFIRTCQKIRSKFSENVEREDCAVLNFFICICCRYFRQLDLAD